ncbi:MAG: DUF503 domain-containing protein [Planctomycetota bacterium]
MIVGVLQAHLAIPGAESLKDKRRVVRSLKDRLHREHQVSVAELAPTDSCVSARLGITLAASDGQRVGATLDRLSEKIRKAPGAEVVSLARRIAHVETLTEADPADELDRDALAAELLEHAGTLETDSEHEDPKV